MNRPKLFFEARMSADDAKVGNVYISGPITSWAWEELNETSGKQVQRALDSVKDAETLNIYIDSPGGYLDEGMTMMRLLKEHAAKEKHAYCMECASAATLLLIPCTRVTAYEGAEFLIHMPRGMAEGTPEEIIRYGEALQKRADSVAGLYASRMTGKTAEEIGQMMKDETWMTPEEAVICGLADDIAPIAPQGGVITMCAARSDEEEAAIARMLGYKPRPHREGRVAHMNKNNGKSTPISGVVCNKDKEDKKSMTLEELKKEAPELVESIMQAGRNEGVRQERARMKALDDICDESSRDIIAEAKYGETPMSAPEAAMAAYGTVHGMVFPILMFPAAILYSLSDLLLPELARCRAEGDARRIRALSERCLHLTSCAIPRHRGNGIADETNDLEGIIWQRRKCMETLDRAEIFLCWPERARSARSA